MTVEKATPPPESASVTPRNQRTVKNPMPWYTPRFWHGMRFGTLMRQFARHGFRVAPGKLHTVLSITATSVFNSGWALAESALYGRRIARTPIEHAPLFILGHWRSGTTYLHELLIRDPRHTYPTTYQCYAAPHFVLTESLFTPWDGLPAPASSADGQHGRRVAEAAGRRVRPRQPGRALALPVADVPRRRAGVRGVPRPSRVAGAGPRPLAVLGGALLPPPNLPRQPTDHLESPPRTPPGCVSSGRCSPRPGSSTSCATLTTCSRRR